jgi:glyoxylase-like metal-dependent hydrolase (beta-lactamase superfamily II)
MVMACLFMINQAQAAELFSMRATQVANNVYAIITPVRDYPNPDNRGWNSNSAFVVTEEGVLLFDTGSSSEIGESIKKVIASVTTKPVRWIVNSHGHGDHWLGNVAFKDTVESIYASEQVASTIVADGQTWVDRFNRMTEGLTGNAVIVPPDSLVKDSTEMRFGDTAALLFLSGNSHSPGDLLLWLPEEKVLLTGDVVYSDRMPSTMNANVKQWINLLGELGAMQPKVVVPGHGKFTDVRGIQRLRELLQAFWLAVEKGYNEGKTDYEMLPEVLQALSSFKHDYPGLEEKVRRDISHVYLQVEAAGFQ